MAITAEREEYLYSYWSEETEDVEAEEWREELTNEEQALVESWDQQYAVGIEKLMKSLEEAQRKTREARRASEMER